MENIPLVVLIGYNLPAEIEEKYNNWTSAAYLPNLVKNTPVIRVDRYHIIKKDPVYPDYFALWHLPNIKDRYAMIDSKFRADLHEDLRATFNKVEYIWITDYLLMKSFRTLFASNSEIEHTTIDNVSFVHIESLHLTHEEEFKYIEWSVKYGNQIYIPLLMKMPGIMGFDRYRNAGIAPIRTVHTPKESDYPSYLHIIYFENDEAFKQFENSPELVSYQRAFKSEVSNNPVSQWYVQYQLVNSVLK
jgi:hypothetical protein